ncbi:MAG: DUF4153 domain-containing protein [Rickettsiales bacterium]|nr:DUF4153 domain-containing protein [Rickettsiales bacterium]
MNMRRFLSSEFIKLAFERFPESFSCAALGTLLSCALIAEIVEGSELYLRFLYMCSAGFLWFLVMRLWVESMDGHRLKSRLVALLLFGAFGVFVFVGKAPVAGMAVFLGALSLLLLVAPYVGRNIQNTSFWGFAHDLSRALFFSLVLGALFTGAVYLIQLTLDYLFHIELPDKFMAYVGIITHAFIVPAYFLARLPHHYSYEDGCELPKDIRLISTYVSIPFVWAYIFILYAYIGKLLMQGSLPSGQLGWMISVFGIAGILTHLLAYPLRDTSSSVARSYYRWFYPALILPIGLLAYALYSRIEPYGLTTNRFLMVLLCVWFAILAIHFTWRGARGQLKWVPLTLSLLLFATSFGPLSIERLPRLSQYQRLLTLLEKNDMLKDGHLVAATKEVSRDDRVAITSKVRFIAGYNDKAGAATLAQIFLEKDSVESITLQKNNYDLQDAFFKAANIEKLEQWELKQEPAKTRYISKDRYINFNQDVTKPIDVSDYSATYSISFYEKESRKIFLRGESYTLNLRENGVVELFRDDHPNEIFSLLLTEALTTIPRDTYVESITGNLTSDKLRFDLKGENSGATLQLFSVSTVIDRSNTVTKVITYSGILLLK